MRNGTMTLHELKIWPEYFQAVSNNEKTFEIRKYDRDYRVGDVLVLREYDPTKQQYTGESVHVQVTYILDERPFVPEGYVCMAIVPL